jgi:Protein of unknown function (DUF2829)
MDFGEALSSLKNGRRVTRSGWNGKNMWLAMSPGVLNNPTHKFWSPAIREFGEIASLDAISVRPYIVMFTADKDIVPWTASQTDILSEDWMYAIVGA